jgi:hypothetical protein
MSGCMDIKQRQTIFIGLMKAEENIGRFRITNLILIIDELLVNKLRNGFEGT